MTENTLIEIKQLKNCLGGNWVHKDVNLTVNREEIVAIIGGSGTGKTTILRCILMLLKPTSGMVKVFGHELFKENSKIQTEISTRIGMLFQQNALFSSMTVLENIMFPIQRHTELPQGLIEEMAMLKLLLVGLEKKDAHKYPSELSGGMKKRAAAARAIALDPELLLLDEPVSGLDPKGAKQFDELLLFLRKHLKLTILMVSHDVASLARVTDKVAFLGEGRVLAFDSLEKIKQDKNPIIQEYFA